MDVINSKQIEELSKIDTATIANAVEPFNFRSNTEGFMGCLLYTSPSPRD